MTNKVRDRRNGWLRELKVGDEVKVKINHNVQHSVYTFQTHAVREITPTGIIVVMNRRFNPNGKYTTKTRPYMTYMELVPDETKQNLMTEFENVFNDDFKTKESRDK